MLLGVIVIWTTLLQQNPRFLSAVNLTNLVLQIAAMGTISVGHRPRPAARRDRSSVGSVSGFAAAVMAVLNVQRRVGVGAIVARSSSAC